MVTRLLPAKPQRIPAGEPASVYARSSCRGILAFKGGSYQFGSEAVREVELVSLTPRRSWIGALLALAVLAIAGCAAPSYTYVADSSQQTYFQVPNSWHQIDDSSLSAQLQKGGLTARGGAWVSDYDAAGVPSAKHAFSATANQPFAQALVAPLSNTASLAMSYNMLRDLILPVTTTARQAAAQRGFPLQGFTIIQQSVIRPGKDVHGIHEVFSYTYPHGPTDTFDQVALTNADSTIVYVLLVHCISACYSKNTSQIDAIMHSFTVGGP